MNLFLFVTASFCRCDCGLGVCSQIVCRELAFGESVFGGIAFGEIDVGEVVFLFLLVFVF